MTRKSIGITLLGAGIVAILVGGVSIGWGVSRMMTAFKTVATFESPGSATITIGEPGTITLWHDYETIHHGTTVRHPDSLPSGFSFELINPGRDVQSVSFASASSTMSSGSTSRKAVGSFELPEAGDYEVRVSGPEPRIFSVTKGGSMAGVGGFVGGMGVGMLGGFLGLGLLIAGVVVLLTGKRKTPPPPPVG